MFGRKLIFRASVTVDALSSFTNPKFPHHSNHGAWFPAHHLLNVWSLFVSIRDTKLEKEGIKGSKLEVTLEYAALQSIEVSSRTVEQEFTEKFGVPNPEDGSTRTELSSLGITEIGPAEIRCAVTSILSQRLMRKMTNSRAVRLALAMVSRPDPQCDPLLSLSHQLNLDSVLYLPGCT